MLMAEYNKMSLKERDEWRRNPKNRAEYEAMLAVAAAYRTTPDEPDDEGPFGDAPALADNPQKNPKSHKKKGEPVGSPEIQKIEIYPETPKDVLFRYSPLRAEPEETDEDEFTMKGISRPADDPRWQPRDALRAAVASFGVAGGQAIGTPPR